MEPNPNNNIVQKKTAIGRLWSETERLVMPTIETQFIILDKNVIFSGYKIATQRKISDEIELYARCAQNTNIDRSHISSSTFPQ